MNQSLNMHLRKKQYVVPHFQVFINAISIDKRQVINGNNSLLNRQQFSIQREIRSNHFTGSTAASNVYFLFTFFGATFFTGVFTFCFRTFFGRAAFCRGFVSTIFTPNASKAVFTSSWDAPLEISIVFGNGSRCLTFTFLRRVSPSIRICCWSRTSTTAHCFPASRPAIFKHSVPTSNICFPRLRF